ncbi:hypothetical protein NQ318_009625 [Aromia moschata]|uniref:Uncharacterized protein n=1 Tax=Aromia moschata TaxID=1265417 RepID=A0AAV8YAR6_9CUCU|nr:hypothetical protein NQ318_009625 [Aromia moschata]
MNSIDFLLTNKDIIYEIRTEIKRLGRPIPDMIISKTDVGKSRNYSRNFNIVSTTDLNVMGGNQSAWTQDGVRDLKHLNERAKKHASYNEKHLHNILDFTVSEKKITSHDKSITLYIRVIVAITESCVKISAKAQSLPPQTQSQRHNAHNCRREYPEKAPRRSTFPPAAPAAMVLVSTAY